MKQIKSLLLTALLLVLAGSYEAKAQFPASCGLTSAQLSQYEDIVRYHFNGLYYTHISTPQPITDPLIYTDLFYFEKKVDTCAAALYLAKQMVANVPAANNIFEAAISSTSQKFEGECYFIPQGASWETNLFNNQFPTGEPLIDSLHTYFGLTSVSQLWSTTLEFTKLPNLVALDSMFRQHNIISFAEDLLSPVCLGFCCVYKPDISYMDITPLGVDLMFLDVDCQGPGAVYYDTLEMNVDYNCLTVINSIKLDLDDVSFNAEVNQSNVDLVWNQTATEGVELIRYSDKDPAGKVIYTNPKSPEGKYTDVNLEPGPYHYVLNGLENGESKQLSEVDVHIKSQQNKVYLAKGVLYINNPSTPESTVEIYDAQGRLMYKANTSDEITEIDFSSYTPGVYLVHIDGGTYKILK